MVSKFLVSRELFVPDFDYGGNHLVLFISIEEMTFMGGNDDSFAQSKPVLLRIKDDIGGSVNDLNKGVEWRSLFGQFLAFRKGRDRDIPG